MTRPSWRRLADAALTGASRHWGLLVLMEAAIVVRGFVVFAYAPAFSFPDSIDYLASAESGEPVPYRPFGYSAFLALLDDVVPVGGVAVLQHALGLLAAVVVYALLVRRGVRRRWSCLAVAPLLLDGYVIAIEHYLLAESLFIALLAAGVVLLLWRERPGWLLAGAAALVLSAAALTRTVGLPVLLGVAAYLLLRLLLRTVRWTALASFAVVSLVAVASYAAWFASYSGTFSTTGYTGHFLYGRSTVFVDCAVTDVPERLRGLCPDEPVGQRPPPDWYVWDVASPAQTGQWSEDDLREFATAAMVQQRGDYVRTTLRAMFRYAQPGRGYDGAVDVCVGYWQFPLAIDPEAGCTADLASRGFDLEPVATKLRPEPAAALAAYQAVVRTPGPVLAVSLLAALLGACRRRRSRTERLDPLLLAGIAVVLVAVPSATALMDHRYGLPVLVVLPAAAALALRGARLPARRAAEPAVDVPDDPSSLLIPVPSGGTDPDRR